MKMKCKNLSHQSHHCPWLRMEFKALSKLLLSLDWLLTLAEPNRQNKDKFCCVTSDISTVNSINVALQRSVAPAPLSKQNHSWDEANQWKWLAGLEGFTPCWRVATHCTGTQGIPTVSLCLWLTGLMEWVTKLVALQPIHLIKWCSQRWAGRFWQHCLHVHCKYESCPRRAALSSHLCLHRSD